jgi:hypothetical protein
MKTVLKVLIDTNGPNCGLTCRFLDRVVDSCTLFGGLKYHNAGSYERHATCDTAGVDARPGCPTVRGRGQVVRTPGRSPR